ncbi:glutamyl-tRNA reductase [Denitrovibrio acetiphilus DSM 12809]|uniref:Glutamyl-tRNA reductase n=1 Tax=Denitrovibrio acetiphilus (strain DSM 12809 / NBRC 114555 / N2460) TaxID=522772 RepID=D4H6I3_DENA2|nr:glutamyl-tRNA reductase [Denitrovibrio acetiphilus]ADD69657.1 glutamyl-tRNA reductase [Denitrovibrio acetiphilus DSM 12809]
MQLAVLGLNHNSAPVEVREKLAVEGDELAQIYKEVMKNDRIYEAMIISTCNRVEYYIVTDDFLCNIESVVDILSDHCGMDRFELRKYTYIHCGEDSVHHIFRVASGLDSLVMGEPQIFGQVKDAFEASREFGGANTFIRKLEEFTIKTTKKVRTNTGIGENPVSVSYAAVELAAKIFGNLNSHNALIIGAGEMCELAAKHLMTSEIGGITVTNRTMSKAEKLACEVGGDTLPFESYRESLEKYDIVISSTGATELLVTKKDAEKAMAGRKKRPMFFIDIAVPRDIDPDINEVENVYVYDIDDLKAVVDANKKQREKEAVKAEEYITHGMEGFYGWLESMKIVPVIKSFRQSFEDIKEAEIKRFCDKNKPSEEEVRKMQYLVSAYMNKVLHTPLKNLKNRASEGGKYSLDEAMKILFELED